jgi:hypothetical protein
VPSLYSPRRASGTGEHIFTIQDQSVWPTQRDTRQQHGPAGGTRFPVNLSLQIHFLLPQFKTALFVPSPEAAARRPSSCATGEDVFLYGGFECYTVALGRQLASTGMHKSAAVNLTGHKMLLNNRCVTKSCNEVQVDQWNWLCRGESILCDAGI